MKASEYLAAMQALIEEHGDLEVETLSHDGVRIAAYPPCLAYRRILLGRESKSKFWYISDKESLKGEKVILI